MLLVLFKLFKAENLIPTGVLVRQQRIMVNFEMEDVHLSEALVTTKKKH